MQPLVYGTGVVEERRSREKRVRKQNKQRKMRDGTRVKGAQNKRRGHSVKGHFSKVLSSFIPTSEVSPGDVTSSILFG